MHAKGSILLLLFLFLLKAPSYGGPFYAPEYDQDKFESIFIANLIKLVDYPESKNKELKLLVLTQNGDSRKFYSQLRKDLHKERIQTSNGRYFDIEVSRQATLQDLHNFDIVLVTNEFNISSKKILEATRNKSILIIGENREFIYSMLNLLAYGTGGRFELNEELLTSRGFKASDKLKTLATTSREQFQNKVSEIEDSMSQIYLDKMKTDRELASKSQIIGDLEKSNQENLQRSEELQDSLDLTSQLAKLQKERVDNQSELIKKQDKIMNQQRYLILISIIAVVLVLAFLFLVYSSRGKIKRQNEEISEQKEQLLVQNKEIID
ncbi:MAG: YfiR family protein, partial [Crocinitomicaceae bacterium]